MKLPTRGTLLITTSWVGLGAAQTSSVSSRIANKGCKGRSHLPKHRVLIDRGLGSKSSTAQSFEARAALENLAVEYPCHRARRWPVQGVQ